MEINTIDFFKKPKINNDQIDQENSNLNKFKMMDKFNAKNDNLYIIKKSKKNIVNNNYSIAPNKVILGVNELKKELGKKIVIENKVMKGKQKVKYNSNICSKILKDSIIEYTLPQVNPDQIIEVKIFSNMDNNINITLLVDNKQIPKSELLLNRNWVTINYIDPEIYHNPKTLTLEYQNILNIKGIYSTVIDKHKILTDNINLSCALDNKTKIFKNTKNNDLTVGIIADNFTYENINYLFKTVYISSRDDIKNLNINILFCESAWGGIDESWRDQIFMYNTKSNITNLILECKKRKIPTIFYAKEDPIFFDGFKQCSLLFDLVITTAEECIPKYKILGCKNVISTTFLINPIIHNPIKTNTVDKVVFPGSYYSFLDNRCDIMKKILDNISHTFDFEIFDRQHLHNKATYQIKKLQINKAKCEFPSNYNKLIKPGLTYSQVIDNIYKKYKCVLNINTISNSISMFSRRAMEVAACGTNIITNDSLAMSTIFGNNVYYLNQKNNYKINLNINTLPKVNIKLYEITHMNYTYKHLFNRIFEHFNINIPLHDKICIITNYETKIDPKVKSCFTIFYDDNPVPVKTFNWMIYLSKKDYYYDEIFIKKILLPTEYVDNHITISLNNNIFVFNNKNIDEDTFILNSRPNLNLESLVDNLRTNFSINNIYNPLRDNYFDYLSYYPNDINHIIINNDLKTIPIIMCTYNRIDRLIDTIQNLNDQTYQNFHLYIWNNNYDKRVIIDHILNKKIQKFNISWFHCQENIGGMGRFVLSKYITVSGPQQYVIFIDDDQILGKNVIYELAKRKNLNCSFHWSGRKFNKSNDYWSSWSNIFTKNGENHNYLDYGGTGTMIIDTKFLDDESFFYINKKYLFIEDLWMSFYVQKFYNYKIHNCSFLDVTVINDNKDQSLNNELKNLKNEFLKDLREHGDWNV